MRLPVLQRFHPALLSVLILCFPLESFSQGAPLVLKLPPTQVNVIAEGMGNAVGADGTLFNATSFNPALLNRAPHGVEAFVLGADVSNDLFGVIDYVRNMNFQANQVYQELSYGINHGDSASINQGLSSVDDLVGHLTDKALQAGAGLNVSVRINKNWGFQVYNSTHAFSQLWRGNLTNALLAIPLDANSANSGAVSNAVGVMAGDLQTGLNQVMTPSQQSQAVTDINNLKNGTESMDQFVQNVSSLGIDPNALKQALLNSLVSDLATLTGLLYSDTVAMVTYNLQPFPDLPGLTVGANLKLVNRHFAYEAFTFNESGHGDQFMNDFKQSTTRWGFDFGCLYRMEPVPLDFGLAVLDLFHQGATADASSGSLAAGFLTDPAPTLVNLSASYHPLPGLRVNGEVDDLFTSSTLYAGSNGASRIKLGADYSLLGMANLRAGFGDQNFGAGLGFVAGGFGLDYSYGVDDLSQSYNHYAQARFVF